MALALANIRFDADCQSRVRLDEETVAEYAYRLKEGAVFPPVVVFFDGSEHWLADGFHRYAAWKGLARERGDEATAEVPADVRQGTRIDAVRYALSANAIYGKRREPGDYIKGYAIAVRCGLCAGHDVEEVRKLLACSERWARELTQAAREALDRERNARIVEARATGESTRHIAAREGISHEAVRKIEHRVVNLRQPAESCQPAVARSLPAAVAALDRPSLSAWSDAIYALEQLIGALEAARPHPVPRKAMPRVQALIRRAGDLLSTTDLEPEHDAA
ncbi:MAG TPA: hypothetical protein PLF63_01890 [Rubrivivax sp.]|nr:hypothetical protein [Rubrivivax sp.]